MDPGWRQRSSYDFIYSSILLLTFPNTFHITFILELVLPKDFKLTFSLNVIMIYSIFLMDIRLIVKIFLDIWVASVNVCHFLLFNCWFAHATYNWYCQGKCLRNNYERFISSGCWIFFMLVHFRFNSNRRITLKSSLCRPHISIRNMFPMFLASHCQK